MPKDKRPARSKRPCARKDSGSTPSTPNTRKPGGRIPIKPTSASQRDDSPWLSTEAAAKYMSFSTKTLYRLVAEGLLPAHRIHRSYRFRRSELDAAMRRDSPPDLTDFIRKQQ